MHAGVCIKRLKVPSLKQSGGQELTAPHCRSSRTKRAELFTVAQCETESGAVSKYNYQSHSNLEVASCMTYCTEYSVFCSILLCHYVDNEVCWHVIIQVVSSFRGNWTCVKRKLAKSFKVPGICMYTILYRSRASLLKPFHIIMWIMQFLMLFCVLCRTRREVELRQHPTTKVVESCAFLHVCHALLDASYLVQILCVFMQIMKLIGMFLSWVLRTDESF